MTTNYFQGKKHVIFLVLIMENLFSNIDPTPYDKQYVVVLLKNE